MVAEYVDGDLHLHDNPLGVLTNAPTLDWHLCNVANYVNLSPDNAQPHQMGKMQLKPLGEGSGMLGLPGDFTPPSRFIKAAFYAQNIWPAQDPAEAALAMTHAVNNFDVVRGMVRPLGDTAQNMDYTQWCTIGNLNDRVYYVRPSIYTNWGKVALAECDFAGTEQTTIELKTLCS